MNDKSKECNCYVGLLLDDKVWSLYKHNIKELLQNLSVKLEEINIDMSKLNRLNPKLGWSKIFNFCPICGKKINWKVIKKELK